MPDLNNRQLAFFLLVFRREFFVTEASFVLVDLCWWVFISLSFPKSDVPPESAHPAFFTNLCAGFIPPFFSSNSLVDR